MRYIYIALCIVVAGFILGPVNVAEASCPALPSGGFGLISNSLASIKVNGECFVITGKDYWEHNALVYADNGVGKQLVGIVGSGSGEGAHNAPYNWNIREFTVTDASPDFDHCEWSVGSISSNLATIQARGGMVCFENFTIEEVKDQRLVQLDFGGISGKIDVADITSVAAHLGEEIGDTNYDVRYDVMFDGHIDTLDLTTVADQWNRTYTSYIEHTWSSPSNCNDWDTTLYWYSFVNQGSTSRTYWIEVWWNSSGTDKTIGRMFEVPAGYGANISARMFRDDDPYAIKLWTNASGSTTTIVPGYDCSYAPPAIIKVNGEPDPFGPEAMAEAASAGTLQTVNDIDDAKIFMTQQGYDTLVAAGEDPNDFWVVPDYSAQQTLAQGGGAGRIPMGAVFLYTDIWLDNPELLQFRGHTLMVSAIPDKMHISIWVRRLPGSGLMDIESEDCWFSFACDVSTSFSVVGSHLFGDSYDVVATANLGDQNTASLFTNRPVP